MVKLFVKGQNQSSTLEKKGLNWERDALSQLNWSAIILVHGGSKFLHEAGEVYFKWCTMQKAKQRIWAYLALFTTVTW